MFPGKRLFPENDYGKKKDAFFQISALLLNVFEKKDGSGLLRSMKLPDIHKAPYVLSGSKNCMYFRDAYSKLNATVCVADDKQRKNIMNSFNFLKSCIRVPPKGKKGQKPKNVIELAKEVIKKMNNPKQKVYNIQKVRKELITEFKKNKVNNYFII